MLKIFLQKKLINYMDITIEFGVEILDIIFLF